MSQRDQDGTQMGSDDRIANLLRQRAHRRPRFDPETLARLNARVVERALAGEAALPATSQKPDANPQRRIRTLPRIQPQVLFSGIAAAATVMILIVVMWGQLRILDPSTSPESASPGSGLNSATGTLEFDVQQIEPLPYDFRLSDLLQLEDGTVLGVDLIGDNVNVGAAKSVVLDLASNTWELSGALNRARNLASQVVSLDERGAFVVGGEKSDPFIPSARQLVGAAEVYHTESGRWEELSSLNVPRTWAGIVALESGEVLVSGGRDSTWQPLASAEVYNPVSNTWQLVGDMPDARAAHQLLQLSSGRILAIGGTGETTGTRPKTRGTVLEYDSGNKSWRRIGRLRTSRSDMAAIELPSGRIMIVGGLTTDRQNWRIDNNSLSTAEIFDPVRGKSQEIESMKYPRDRHNLHLINDRFVAVVGGQTPGYPNIPIEYYDLVTNRWYEGPLLYASVYVRSISLEDGRILVASGAVRKFPVQTAVIVEPRLAELRER